MKEMNKGLIECFRRGDLNATKALLTPENVNSEWFNGLGWLTTVLESYIRFCPLDDPSFVYYLLSIGYIYKRYPNDINANKAFSSTKPRILYAILTTGGYLTDVPSFAIANESLCMKIALDTQLTDDTAMYADWSRAFLARRTTARIHAMIILREMSATGAFGGKYRDVGKMIARVIWENRGQ